MDELQEYKEYQILFLRDLIKFPDRYKVNYPNLKDEIYKISKIFDNICEQMKLNPNKEEDFVTALNSLYDVYIDKKTNFLAGFDTEEKCKNFVLVNNNIKEEINDDLFRRIQYKDSFTYPFINNTNLDNIENYQACVNQILKDNVEKIFDVKNNFVDFAEPIKEIQKEEYPNEIFNEIKQNIKNKNKVIDVVAENFEENLKNNDEIENVVSVDDMFKWIKDKDSIVFPFDEKDTIENEKFAFNFYQTCLNPKVKLSQLKDMLAMLKAKNMQLANMLDETKNGKMDVINELKEELKKSEEIKQDFASIYKDDFDTELDVNLYEKIKKEAQYKEYKNKDKEYKQKINKKKENNKQEFIQNNDKENIDINDILDDILDENIENENYQNKDKEYNKKRKNR